MAYRSNYRRPSYGTARFSGVAERTCSVAQHDRIERDLAAIEALAARCGEAEQSAILALVGTLDLRLLHPQAWAEVPMSVASAAIDTLVQARNLAQRTAAPDPDAPQYHGLPPHERVMVTRFDGTCKGCGAATTEGKDLAVLVLNKWQPWCLPCATTSPAERQAQQAAASKAAALEQDAAREARKALAGLHRVGIDIYRVDDDGTVWHRRGRQYRRVREDRVPLLNVYTVLDAEAASAYGLETGRCCACGDLIGHGDSRRSIAVGYGPVCASRWGWFFPTEEEAENIIARRQSAAASH